MRASNSSSSTKASLNTHTTRTTTTEGIRSNIPARPVSMSRPRRILTIPCLNTMPRRRTSTRS